MMDTDMEREARKQYRDSVQTQDPLEVMRAEHKSTVLEPPKVTSTGEVMSDGKTLKCVLCGKEHVRQNGLMHLKHPACQECTDSFNSVREYGERQPVDLLMIRRAIRNGKRNTDPEFLDMLKAFIVELERAYKECTTPVNPESKLYWMIWSHRWNLLWRETEVEEQMKEYQSGFPNLRQLFVLWQSRARSFAELSKGGIRRSAGKLKREKKFYALMKKELFERYGV